MRLRRLVSVVPLAALLSLCACAGTRRDAPSASDARASVPSPTGCRPFFISPMNDAPEAVPNHSCWHRLWEVPVAAVVVPVAIGVLVGVGTAPIWVPLLLR